MRITRIKRIAAIGLVGSLFATVVSSALGADVSHATGVTTSSKGWVVTLSIAKWNLPTGSSMAATLTIVNRTGHVVRVPSCQTNAIFVVGLGNAKVPYEPISGTIVCSTTLTEGTNVFCDRISAAYQQCFRSGGVPACGPGGTMPGLPPGFYRTVVEWPSSPPFIRHPGTLWVTVTRRQIG
jgi:hypothetical protein